MTADQILDSVYQQILAIKRENRKPTEVRIGAVDYYEIVKAMGNPCSGPLVLALNEDVTLFGVPVRRLPLAHAISVIS